MVQVQKRAAAWQYNTLYPMSHVLCGTIVWQLRTAQRLPYSYDSCQTSSASPIKASDIRTEDNSGGRSKGVLELKETHQLFLGRRQLLPL